MIRDTDLIRWEREAERLRRLFGIPDTPNWQRDLSPMGEAVCVGIPSLIAELRNRQGEQYVARRCSDSGFLYMSYLRALGIALIFLSLIMIALKKLLQ